jgi:hypothetical protein
MDSELAPPAFRPLLVVVGGVTLSEFEGSMSVVGEKAVSCDVEEPTGPVDIGSVSSFSLFEERVSLSASRQPTNGSKSLVCGGRVSGGGIGLGVCDSRGVSIGFEERVLCAERCGEANCDGFIEGRCMALDPEYHGGGVSQPPIGSRGGSAESPWSKGGSVQSHGVSEGEGGSAGRSHEVSGGEGGSAGRSHGVSEGEGCSAQTFGFTGGEGRSAQTFGFAGGEGRSAQTFGFAGGEGRSAQTYYFAGGEGRSAQTYCFTGGEGRNARSISEPSFCIGESSSLLLPVSQVDGHVHFALQCGKRCLSDASLWNEREPGCEGPDASIRRRRRDPKIPSSPRRRRPPRR